MSGARKTMATSFWSMPMTAGQQDIPVGVDELGNVTYQTPQGQRYTVRQQAPQRQSVVKGAVNAFRDDPWGVTKNALAGAAEGVWQGISAPGRAAAGEPVTYGDVAATAMDWALPQVPGLGAKYDPATVNIFAGAKAKTADHSALAKAQEMVAQGVGRDEIWAETGWFTGPDGKWRFEIDDSGANFTSRPSGTTLGELGNVLAHPGLSAAYPDAANIGTKAEVSKVFENVGGYTPFENREHLGLFDLQEDIFARGKTDDAVESTLLHEAQHAIQAREGFSSGGNQSIGRELSQEPMLGEIQALQDYIFNSKRAIASSGDPSGPFELELAASIADAEAELAGIQARLGNRPRDAFSAYQRIAGEAEARNVEARRNMTAAERRAAPPWATLDVPEDELILRYGGGQY